VHGYAPQIPVRGPAQAGLLADEGGQGRGTGYHLQQRLGAEVRISRVDGEPEGGAI
jgi:hypothetical protein